MNKIERYQHESQDHITGLHEHKPYLKGIHRSWLFWLFLFLMLLGIGYYIMSIDFSIVPHRPLKRTSENSKIQ